MNILSSAQCVGYVAFLLGITAFLQKKDSRLKFFNASECLVYFIHFLLLGNMPASLSALISSARSFLSLKYRSPALAAAIIALNIIVGCFVVKSWLGILPVGASCLATYAVFMMKGISMRMAFLVATFAWLINNIVGGSIGGTMLEIFIASANILTMTKMALSSARQESELA